MVKKIEISSSFNIQIFCCYRKVELFYIDTGQNVPADVSSIHSQVPPMLCNISQQALECILRGVELVSPGSAAAESEVA